MDQRTSLHVPAVAGLQTFALYFSAFGISIKDVLCMTLDDADKIFIQKHDGTQIIK